MLRILLSREHDSPTALLVLEVLDGRLDRALEDVVREHYEHAIVAGKALREAQRIGNAALLLLVGILQEADPVGVAVSEEAEELACVHATGDEHDLLDPGRDDRLDGV